MHMVHQCLIDMAGPPAQVSPVIHHINHPIIDIIVANHGSNLWQVPSFNKQPTYGSEAGERLALQKARLSVPVTNNRRWKEQTLTSVSSSRLSIDRVDRIYCAVLPFRE